MGKVISEGDDLKRKDPQRYDRTLRGIPISKKFGIFEADDKEREINRAVVHLCCRRSLPERVDVRNTNR